MNKLIFGHLNVNSLRTKFDIISEKIKGSTDIFMVSETKLDDRFPEGQFLIIGFHSQFRFDRNRNGGGIVLSGIMQEKICNLIATPLEYLFISFTVYIF